MSPSPLPPLPCVLGARRIYYHRVLFSLGLFNSLPEISFNQMGLCYGAQGLTWSPSCSVLMAAENRAAPDPSPRLGAAGGACAVTGAPLSLGAVCLFPFGGLGQLVPDLPSSLARWREAGDFLCQPKTRFRYPSC